MGTKFYKAQKISFFRSVIAGNGRFIIVFFLAFISFNSGFSQTSLSFTQLSGDFSAPGKGAQNWGLHPWNDITQPTIPAGNSKAKNYYTRFNWRDIESSTSQGSYSWSNFDNFVNQAIDAGAMFTFGVMPLCDGCGTGGAIPQYVVNLMASEGKPGPTINGEVYPNYQSTNWSKRYSALLRAIADHIKSTSRNGHSYTSAFAGFDLRHAGNFGEFADLYTNAQYGAGAQVTDTYLNAMVDTAIAIYPDVQLTVPMGYFCQNGNLYGNASGAPGQASAYKILTATNNFGRIGWRRDNIGDDGYNVYFTGNTGTYNGVAFQPLIMNMWKFAPIGGEPSSSQGGVSRCGTIYCDMHNENLLFHYSFFGNGNAPGNVSNSSGAVWSQLQTNWRNASAEMGYRLILTGGSMTTTLSSGGPFNITVNWQNIGIAPVYEKWNVTYELRNSGGAVVWSGNSAFTPRLFLPQPAATPASDNFTLSSVPSGTYSMYMIIRDPLNYKAPLPLGINGRNADGSYLIRSNITVGTGGPVNQPPVANAGSDLTITLPTAIASLTGTGSDADGTIASYAWTKTSGPATGTIASPSTAITSITGLVQGVYVFTLTVKDNQGATATDNIQVTVNPIVVVNQPPVAVAGSDLTIQLPTSSVSLTGTGSDADGSVASYAWSKASGPAAGTIASPGTANTSITGLVQGTYVFTLTVKDNVGATSTDNVQVTVNAAAPANQPPVAVAGSDLTIQLPTSTVSLTGTGSDADGSVASYAWTKASGPAAGTIASPGAANTSITGLVQGTYVFTLTVKDNAGATASDNIQVTVNAAAPANQPPIAKAGTDMSITMPANSANVNGSASSDPDGSISSYQWSKVSGPGTGTIANSAAMNTTVNSMTAGVYAFQLKVTDNAGASSLDTVKVTVNAAVPPPPPNQSPIANAGTDQNITLPTNSVSINGSTSSDPDGSISAFLWAKLSGPAQFTIGNNAAASTIVNNLTAGVYTFQLRVTDNLGAIALDTVKIIVNAAPVNQPPVANAGADISIILPTNITNLNGSASSDADGTISTYAWSQVSGPNSAAIGSAANASTGISGLIQGSYVFALRVTDNSGATDLDSLKVTVNAAPNLPPVAFAGNSKTITLPVNSTSLDGSLSTDPDGSIVSYNWIQTSGPGTASITGANTSVANAGSLVAGVYNFQLTVTDNRGAASNATVKITVAAAGIQPPIANAGADQTITLPTNSVTINGGGSSAPSGSIVSYVWTEQSGPSTISLTNAVQNTLTNLQAGVYVFKLVITDNNAATGSDLVTITVNPAANQAPVANAGTGVNLTLPANTASLSGTASYDPDGTISAYSWTRISGPSAPTVTGANTATLNLSGLIVGTYTYQLTVTDNSGVNASAQVKIIVSTALNVPPVANAGPNQSITAPASSVILNGSASMDPDGSIVSYSWVTISGPGSITINNSNTVTPSAIGLVTGGYVFELTVTDNTGASSKDQISVTVLPATVLPNQPPVANAGNNNFTITLPDNSVTLDASNSFDPDGTITGYSWKNTSGPSAASISGASTVSPTASQLVEGTYVFELTVTDNNGATNIDYVNVIVNPSVSKVNQEPVSNAGDDNITIILPQNSTSLDGSKSYDPDGTIVTYSWKNTSGPSVANISGANTATPTVSDLEEGTYSFELTVTDNNGASTIDYVNVIVNHGHWSGGAGTDRLSIYPNPAHSVVYQRINSQITGTVKVSIYDMTGKLVLASQFEKTSDVAYNRIVVDQLAPGMYTIQVNIANRKTMVNKFIKN